MFCTKCGHELSEEDMFCPYCGEKVEKNVAYMDIGQPKVISSGKHHKAKEKRKPMIMAIVAGVLIILALCGGTVYATAGLNMQKDRVFEEVQDCGFTEYEEKVNDASQKWEELGLFDVKEKQDVISDL